MAIVLAVGGAVALATGLAWSLASSAATAWALAAVAGAALGGRAVIPPAARAWATGLAAAAAIAEVGVLTRIADASGPAAGTAAVAAAGVLAVAARALPDPVERIALEATCVIAAICAGPAIGDDEQWGSIALLVAGVAAAAIAMDLHRRAVGWLSGVLLTGSTWLRLIHSDVSTPEAYTLPPAAALLIYGAIAALRDRELNSWRTYGPGLTLGLIPSLLATFDDDGLARPLLLGLAALLVLLAGVAAKLQAPLALGGATLAHRRRHPDRALRRRGPALGQHRRRGHPAAGPRRDVRASVARRAPAGRTLRRPGLTRPSTALGPRRRPVG